VSEERARVIEMFVDAWNRRDLEAALKFVGDDFRYVNPPNALEPGTRRGSDGATTVMTKQWEALGDARLEIVRMHERDDQVVAEAQLARTMPGSTSRLEVNALMRWTFDGDRLIGMEVVGAGFEYSEALSDAGLG
jgi:limonene-1,2-epoxide hydrolase